MYLWTSIKVWHLLRFRGGAYFNPVPNRIFSSFVSWTKLKFKVSLLSTFSFSLECNCPGPSFTSILIFFPMENPNVTYMLVHQRSHHVLEVEKPQVDDPLWTYFPPLLSMVHICYERELDNCAWVKLPIINWRTSPVIPHQRAILMEIRWTTPSLPL